MRPDVIKSILNGLSQKEKINQRKEGKAERLPVTISVLKLIRHELQKADWPLAKKRMILTICYLAFFGSFRIHEILAKEKLSFDVQTTLMCSDLKIENWEDKKTKVMKVWLKSPKELRKGTGIMVEVFETNNYLCPIRAFKK